MSETNERSVASTGSVVALNTEAAVENLRHYVEDCEHKTVAIYTKDGRSSCGVFVAVHVLKDAMKEISRLQLTPVERKAVRAAIGWCDDRDTETITALTGLLERLK